MIKLTLPFVLVSFLSNASLSFASDGPYLDESIVGVYSGPMEFGSDGLGSHYRLIVELSEVYHKLTVQRLAYGEENCCVTVADTIPVKRGLPRNIYSVDDVVWTGYDTVRMTVGETRYELVFADGDYTVGRIK